MPVERRENHGRALLHAPALRDQVVSRVWWVLGRHCPSGPLGPHHEGGREGNYLSGDGSQTRCSCRLPNCFYVCVKHVNVTLFQLVL